VLFRLAYLGVTNVLALQRLLPMSDRDKDAEILPLRHQIVVDLLGTKVLRCACQPSGSEGTGPLDPPLH
jgi:hypothetical protein